MTDEPITYLFGPYRLDIREGVLFRDGQPIPLTLKASGTLIVLLERHGHVVTKAELMARVWPDTAVEDGNLTQNIYALRKLLGDARESGITIETVPRRGYRLSGEVTAIRNTALSRSHGIIEPRLNERGDQPVSDAVSSPPRVAAPARPPDSHRRNWIWWNISASSAAAITTLIFLWSTGLERRSATSAALPAPAAELVPLTSAPGQKMHPSLSPDGGQVAFVWNRGAGFQVYVTAIGTDTTLQLTRGEGGIYPAWAPDGRTVAFVRRFIGDDGGRKAGVFLVSSSGGPERALWIDSTRSSVGSGLDWSPDGRWVIASARPALGRAQALLMLAVDGSERRWATSPDSGAGDAFPAFSPVGDHVAFVHGDEIGASLRLLQVATGDIGPPLYVGEDIRRIAWSPDGQSLTFDARQNGGHTLWRISVKGGDPVPIAGIGDGASDPSIARRSGRLAYTQSLIDQNVYRAELTGSRKGTVAQVITSNRSDMQPDISPDGSRIAFVSSRTGPGEVWVMNAMGHAPTRVTDMRTSCRFPRWSPDGQFIAFAASGAGEGRRHIYTVDLLTGLSRRLTAEDSHDQWPTWSHDGRWIYFMSDRHGEREVWKVPADGGSAIRVTTSQGRKAWASSDGRFLYFSNETPAVWRLPLAGGVPERLFELPRGTAWGGEWALSSQGIYWINKSSGRTSIDLFTFADGRQAT